MQTAGLFPKSKRYLCHSQSLLAANKWSYVSAPKLQCVYTLSLLHSTSHPPVPTDKGLGESGSSNTTDRPGRLSS